MPRASTLLVLACLVGLGLTVGLPAWGADRSLAAGGTELSAPNAALHAARVGALQFGLAHDGDATHAPTRARRAAHALAADAAAAFDVSLREARRVCKPGGPWGAQLQARGLGADGSVAFDVVVRPHLPHEGLRWSLELPPGARVLEGRTAGDVLVEPGEEFREPLRVALPADLGAGSVRLDVTALHDARLASTREVDFGASPEVGRPERFVADNGAVSALAVLPSVTREGR